jgi:hypothetical protein
MIEATHRYDDIIDLPHHVSQVHKPLTTAQRAAQFLPFSALNGFDKVVHQKDIVTVSPDELSEDELASLNLALVQIRRGDRARVVYYEAGAYHELTGTVGTVDLAGLTIQVAGYAVRVGSVKSLEILTEG